MQVGQEDQLEEKRNRGRIEAEYRQNRGWHIMRA